MPTFDYKCDCGAVKTNLLVKKHDQVVPCTECKKPMKKAFNYVPYIHSGEGDVDTILDNSIF